MYEGEAVIVAPEDSTLHALNPVGTLIWEAADGRTALGAIVGRLCEAFDVDRATAARDAATFVELLCRRGLLTVEDTPPEASAEAVTEHSERWAEPGRRPWEAPAILSEQIFETTALACGKLPAQGGKCNARPKAS